MNNKSQFQFLAAIPLMFYVVIGIVLLLTFGGFAIFAAFNLIKFVGIGMIGAGIYMAIKKNKNKLIQFILMGVGLFLLLK